MQKVTYSERLKQLPALYRLAEQASTHLDNVISQRYAPLISVEWDRTEDERGQPVATLTLKEEGDEVTARLSPRELEDPTDRRIRLLRLWGDLLQLGIRKRLDGMQGTNGGTED
jgi:hypothetical protein